MYQFLAIFDLSGSFENILHTKMLYFLINIKTVHINSCELMRESRFVISLHCKIIKQC